MSRWQSLPFSRRHRGGSLHQRILLAMLLMALGLTGTSPVVAQDESVRSRLDAIQNDMVQLRFEQALTSIEALLGDSRLTPSELAEAHILRSQTHVAFGDLDAAEDDYREILRLRPVYVPEVSLTPKKAMRLFEAVRKEIVGRLRIDLDPPDAVLTVDGQQATTDVDGVLLLTAGEYVLRGDRRGYDPFDLTVQVLPDTEQTVSLQLTPNARSVILQTEPEGVQVFLDSVFVGVTERPEMFTGASRQPAQLVLENLSLGEHEYELRLPCFRTERRIDILTVDLLDPSAKLYDVVNLQRSLATLALDGGPAGAEVTIDGESIGRLPVDAHEVCPGNHDIAVTQRGRKIWSTARELGGSTETRLPVVARPNAVILANELPSELRRLVEDFNTDLRDLPGGADLTTVSGWELMRLPGDTDLAVAIVRSELLGGGDRSLVYSPILRAVESRGRIADEFDRPDWQTPLWGVNTVDSDVGGVALVVEVAAGSPAAVAGLAEGDRILTVEGRPVSASAVLVEAFAEASATRKTKLDLEWSDAAGETRKAAVAAIASPEIASRSESVSRDAARAAWAVVDALEVDEPAALANLAKLFSGYGQHKSAAETWRRVRWAGSTGIGNGTAQYYLGHALVELGDEAAAIEAYRRAAATDATAFDDLGPKVGLAALDCLADLGVAP